MKGKISSRLLKTLKPGDTPYDINDTELRGFILRVEPSGRLSYFAGYRLADGRRSRKKLDGDVPLTPKQARDEAKKVFEAVRKGIDPNREQKRGYTVKSFLDEVYEPWMLKEYKSGKSQISRIRTSCKKLMSARMDRLDAGKVEKWRTERLGGNRKMATVNRDLSALKALLARALEWGYLDTHPFGQSKVRRKPEDDSADVRYLEADEEERLFDALDVREERYRSERDSANAWRRIRGYAELPSLRDSRFVDYLKPIITVALHTGCRRGELFDLKWEDVSLSRGKGQTPMLIVHGRTSKSGKTRHIPLNEVAANTLRDWKRQGSDRGLVFPNRRGQRIDNISAAWARILKDADIQGLRYHDLRHTFASRLVQNGVKLPIVKSLMGHSTYALTLRYAHIDPKDEAAAVSRLVPTVSGILEFPKEGKRG